MKTLAKLFSFKLLTSFFALIYSILQVRYFGTTRVIEVFFAAQTLIYLVTSLTQSGYLSEIFLPEFHKLNLIKEKLGFKALSIVLNRMSIFGTVIIAIVFFFTPFFIDLLVPGFSQEDKSQSILMFRVLLPYLFLQINNSFFIMVLNAEEKYGRAEFLGITNTLINIFSLVFLYNYLGIWSLIFALLLGKLIEFIFYYIELYKIGFRYSFITKMPEFDHNLFFKTMQSTIIYVCSTQIFSIILTASISYLPEGTFAIFKYVQNLAIKIKGLFIQPFLVIFFTTYSLLLQQTKSIYYEFKNNISSIFNINIIIIIVTILFGDFVIDLIWGSKKFNYDDIKLAYVFLIFNVFANLIASLGDVYRKMTVAQEQGKKLYSFWIIAQLLTALFTYVLISNFKIYGLFLIIPINFFLLSSASFLCYKKTINPLNYRYISLDNALAFIFIIVAFLLKYFSTFYFKNDFFNFFLLIGFVPFLIIYHLIKTYRIINQKK